MALDFNKISNQTQISENISKLNQFRDEYFSLLNEAISLMDDADLKEFQEGLFGKEDYTKGIQNMTKTINETKKSLNDLLTGLKSDRRNSSPNKVEKNMVTQDITYATNLLKQVEELEKRLNDPKFQAKATEMASRK